MITCVSGSLASSSRKRIMTPKTSSLEVFAGSHLQEGWSIIIKWSIPILIVNCSVNYNQRETIMLFRRGTCWLWTPTLSCPWHPWKTNIFTFLDFELVLIFILPPFQFDIKKTCKIKTWMYICAAQLVHLWGRTVTIPMARVSLDIKNIGCIPTKFAPSVARNSLQNFLKEETWRGLGGWWQNTEASPLSLSGTWTAWTSWPPGKKLMMIWMMVMMTQAA